MYLIKLFIGQSWSASQSARGYRRRTTYLIERPSMISTHDRGSQLGDFNDWTKAKRRLILISHQRLNRIGNFSSLSIRPRFLLGCTTEHTDSLSKSLP